ncbi:hypothetical protein TNCT_75031, partial [Trichonephila clavata]
AVTELNQLNLLDIKSRFLDEDEDAFLSGDSGQLGTEEIFIDVPTIRPPVGFRSDNSSYDENTKYSPNLSTKSNSSNNSSKKNSYQTSKTIISSSTSTGFGSKTNSDKESADSALSESESDSGLNWSLSGYTRTASRSEIQPFFFKNNRREQNHCASAVSRNA